MVVLLQLVVLILSLPIVSTYLIQNVRCIKFKDDLALSFNQLKKHWNQSAPTLSIRISSTIFSTFQCRLMSSSPYPKDSTLSEHTLTLIWSFVSFSKPGRNLLVKGVEPEVHLAVRVKVQPRHESNLTRSYDCCQKLQHLFSKMMSWVETVKQPW